MNAKFSMLDIISVLITTEDNKVMTRLSDKDKVRAVVFNLNGDSSCGPNGFTRSFFQTCWEIVGEDITYMVSEFFLWV